MGVRRRTAKKKPAKTTGRLGERLVHLCEQGKCKEAEEVWKKLVEEQGRKPVPINTESLLGELPLRGRLADRDFCKKFAKRIRTVLGLPTKPAEAVELAFAEVIDSFLVGEDGIVDRGSRRLVDLAVGPSLARVWTRKEYRGLVQMMLAAVDEGSHADAASILDEILHRCCGTRWEGLSALGRFVQDVAVGHDLGFRPWTVLYAAASTLHRQEQLDAVRELTRTIRKYRHLLPTPYADEEHDVLQLVCLARTTSIALDHPQEAIANARKDALFLRSSSFTDAAVGFEDRFDLFSDESLRDSVKSSDLGRRETRSIDRSGTDDAELSPCTVLVSRGEDRGGLVVTVDEKGRRREEMLRPQEELTLRMLGRARNHTVPPKELGHAVVHNWQGSGRNVEALKKAVDRVNQSLTAARAGKVRRDESGAYCWQLPDAFSLSFGTADTEE